MASTNLKTYTGNRIVVEFDGKTVGAVQSVSIDDNYGLDAVAGVGDIHVQEYVPTRAVHQVSVSVMTLFKSNMRDLGIAVENGDAALRGTVFDIVIYSRDTGAVLRKARSCSYGSGRVDVATNRIVVQSGTFMALDVSGGGI